MTSTFRITVPIETLRWFRDSPDAGDPTCICSVCGQVISEEAFPIRMFWERGPMDVLEARFHDGCLGEVSTLKIGPRIQSDNT